MNENLLRFNKTQKFLIFDTETEGLNLIHSRPWQCAWMIAKGGKIISKHNRFIWWDNLNVSKDAARVTKFDRHFYGTTPMKYKVAGKVVEAEAPQVVWRDFSKHLYDPSYKIVGQNLLGFDVYIVNVWRQLLGLLTDYSFVPRILDTRALAVGIKKENKCDLNNILGWQYRMIGWRDRGMKVSQNALLKHYGIDHDPAMLHDALYDNEMLFQIFQKQLFDIEL